MAVLFRHIVQKRANRFCKAIRKAIFRFWSDDLDNELAIENAWVRYAPLSWIGIKAGRMSMAPTANATLTYEFLSDLDDDFVLYSAGSVLNKDGFEIDAWLGEGIKVGVAELQGMSRGSPDTN